MKQPIITRYELNTNRPMPRPITIAQASDIHERHAEDILALVQSVKPDLIVVTGDTLERYDNRPQYYFEHRPIKRAIINVIHYTNHFLRKFEGEKRKPHTANSRSFLSGAKDVAPVIVSLGNHEQKLFDSDLDFYREQGITLLDNAYTRVNIDGFEMLVGGMSSWDYEEFLDEFAQLKGYKLLLSHHPERFESCIKYTDVDLTLSGHTHGGQIQLGSKGRGFFVPGQGLFGRYAHGLFFDGRLIVSAGCSNTVAMPRIRNPRELVVVTLRGKDDGKD